MRLSRPRQRPRPCSRPRLRLNARAALLAAAVLLLPLVPPTAVSGSVAAVSAAAGPAPITVATGMPGAAVTVGNVPDGVTVAGG